MTHEEYLAHDATALAARVRAGDVTAGELLDIALARVEALNPHLNAVVHLMVADAREAATRSDGSLGKGRHEPITTEHANVRSRPFTGVPFLAKDLLSMYAGHPTSAGSRFLADVVVDWDSELARRVKETGVSVFGKTNLPEWGLLPTTEPDLWGPCRNPWDTERTPGGSSGGSAAAVAGGIVPMAGGGDGGGSIRIPASCCGLFGLKPTRGRTPTGPRRGQNWRGATVEHVITRSVRDSAAMLDATHGPDPGAPFEIPAPSRPYREEVEAGVGPLRIAWTVRPPADVEIHPHCVDAVEDAVALLQELGHELVAAELPVDGPLFSRHFLTVLASELSADLAEASSLVGRRPRRGEVEPATRALALLAGVISSTELAAALRGLEVMGRSIGEFFESYDAILTPTLSKPPPTLGTIGPSAAEVRQLRLLGIFGSGRLVRAAGLIDEAARDVLSFTPFTPMFNATGHPAVSLPLRWDEDGLPVGVHVVGRLGREDLLFRLAGQLELARPWFDRLPALARSVT
jgi:amidase